MKHNLINIDPEIMSGVPVFAGTRVPIMSLFQHLEAGVSLGEFLDDFPSIKKHQIIQLLERAQKLLFANLNLAPENFSVREFSDEESPLDKLSSQKIKRQENRLINVNPLLMSGTPVFAGTRVPVESLFQHLIEGVTIQEFCNDFDTVSLEQAQQVLNLAQKLLLTNFTLIAYENRTGRKRTEALAA